MTTDLEGAIAAVEAIHELDLADALKNDLASVKGAHAAVKKVTDNLKTQLVTVLDLELPKSSEGDND